MHRASISWSLRVPKKCQDKRMLTQHEKILIYYTCMHLQLYIQVRLHVTAGQIAPAQVLERKMYVMFPVPQASQWRYIKHFLHHHRKFCFSTLVLLKRLKVSCSTAVQDWISRFFWVLAPQNLQYLKPFTTILTWICLISSTVLKKNNPHLHIP